MVTKPVVAPKILVVTPTLNEASTIESVLRELSVDLPRDGSVDFVVADGGSTDATCDMVRKLAVVRTDLRLIHNPKRRQGPGVNLAVELFGKDADILIRCDAHASYPPGFIRRLTESINQIGADSIVVPFDCVGKTCFQKAVAWVSNTAVGSGGAAHRGGRKSGFVDHGSPAAFRVGSFRKLGGYDESFTHNEDAELDCRQIAQGGTIYLNANIRLVYHPRANALALWKQYFNYGRGRSRTIRRHSRSIRIRQVAVPAHLVFSSLCLLMAPFAPFLLLWPFLYTGILGATSVVTALRCRSACGLLAGPAAFVMHTAWAIGFLFGMATHRQESWKLVERTAGNDRVQ